MLARMRTQTIADSTEINLIIPNEHAANFYHAIRTLLEDANLPFSITNDDGDTLFLADEVLPKTTPARLLRGLRTREGVTQEQFAERLGITTAQVSDMENGVCPVSEALAQRIADAFNTAPQLFFSGT